MEKTAAEEIKERAAMGDSGRVPEFAEVIVGQVCGEGAYDGEELTLRLARLKARSEEALPQLAVKSSVFGLGFVKRLYAKLAETVLAPIFRQQRQYQMELAGCMWDLKERMNGRERQLEERLGQLEGQKEALEERIRQLERQKEEVEKRAGCLERKQETQRM